jgi:hypothetical protein
MSGIPPWLHSRATEESKNIWKNADIYYDWWIKNSTRSYCKLSTVFNFKYYLAMNLIKKFREGWVPSLDVEWKKFKENKL